MAGGVHGSCDGVAVAALYKFVKIADPAALKGELLAATAAHSVRGMLLVAPEGINGTIAAAASDMSAFLAALGRDARFAEGLEIKHAKAVENPFPRMRVREKAEIVALGVPGVDPTRQVGEYVEPKDWNRIISDPDVTVVDTRNAYEVALGTFQRAVDPGTDTFKEFPAFCSGALKDKTKKVAMFCTGGIRCEKASSYLLQEGYETVYHLKGGILKYLEDIPEEASLWKGACFVFDKRVAVSHGLEPSGHTACCACRKPLAADDLTHPAYKAGVSCRHCVDSTTEAQKHRFRAREEQAQLAIKRGRCHLGTDAQQPRTGPKYASKQKKRRTEGAPTDAPGPNTPCAEKPHPEPHGTEALGDAEADAAATPVTGT